MNYNHLFNIASNSENEDNISSDNISETDLSSGEDEESNSEEELFSSEAELSEAENIEAILDSQSFEDELNLETNLSTSIFTMTHKNLKLIIYL
jgi:hypothetical protein